MLTDKHPSRKAPMKSDDGEIRVPYPASHVEKPGLVAINDRGHELFCWSVNDPQQFSCVRIVTGHTYRAAKHHLCASADLTNERHAVAAFR